MAGARPKEIATLAGWIADAERPVVIAQRGAGSAEAFDALSRLANDWALPVCHYWATALAVPTTHAMHVGADPGPWLAKADLVIVLDSLAPWEPDRHPPNPAARTIKRSRSALTTTSSITHCI